MAYGLQTLSANGAVLFDSENENMFFYSRQTFDSTTAISFPALSGKTLIPIARSLEVSGYVAQAWATSQSYVGGVPHFEISFASNGLSTVEVMFFYSNRTN